MDTTAGFAQESGPMPDFDLAAASSQAIGEFLAWAMS